MIFYRKEIKGKQNKDKELTFDLFQNYVNTNDAFSKQELKNVESVYNFDTSNGELGTSYGFKKLQMPTSTTDLDNEEEVVFDGDEIKAIWSFKWHDSSLAKSDKYYIVYFNDLNDIGFANLFNFRPELLFSNATTFTETPVGCISRYRNEDAMVFSSVNDGMFLLTGSMAKMFPDAPKVVSLCSQYGKCFAISAQDRAYLYYSDNTDIVDWTEAETKKLTFEGERGRLTKLFVMEDFVVIFRDFGISKLTAYSTKDEFDISHPYQSDSYIYPETIASAGDKIYFLNGEGLFTYNGSSVKKINLKCGKFLQNLDKTNASAVCFEGKYYLSCKYDFNDNNKIGCEKESDGFVNNALIVIDINNDKINIVRGYDIKQLCVLNNPYKSKVVACFNGKNKGLVGEITFDGIYFNEKTSKFWKSGLVDFGHPEKLKKLKFMTIKSKTDCDIFFHSDEEEKTYHVEGKDKIQRIKLAVVGKEMEITITANENNVKISNVKIGYSII